MESILNAAPWWITGMFYSGIIVGAVSICFCLWALLESFFQRLEHLIYIYKYKHRFNKRPLAKCYCKDCDDWHPHSPQATEGRCWKFGYTTADNWFCWDAKPRETERE